MRIKLPRQWTKGWRRLKPGSTFEPGDRVAEKHGDNTYLLTISGYGGVVGPDDYVIRKKRTPGGQDR